MLPRPSRVVRPGMLLAALSFLAHAGCGGSPSQPEAAKSDGQAADQKKIQELSKKGYDFKEIRSIMKGEEPEPKTKKKANRGRR